MQPLPQASRVQVATQFRIFATFTKLRYSIELTVGHFALLELAHWPRVGEMNPSPSAAPWVPKYLDQAEATYSKGVFISQRQRRLLRSVTSRLKTPAREPKIQPQLDASLSGRLTVRTANKFRILYLQLPRSMLSCIYSGWEVFDSSLQTGSSLRHWPPGTNSLTVRAAFFCAHMSRPLTPFSSPPAAPYSLRTISTPYWLLAMATGYSLLPAFLSSPFLSNMPHP
jgi:hypothetical protein